MTAFRRTATITCLALTLLAACTPAGPAAPAPTATPVAATSVPAPTVTPTVTASPTPLPQPRLILPVDGATLTPAEQVALQARLDNPPAEWGYDPAVTDFQVARGEDGRLYLTLLAKPATPDADPQSLGRIIVLESLTGPAIAIADLAAAQAAAQESGLAPVTYIWVDYEGRMVGADENGQPVVIFDLAANTWRPDAPPTPEPTATPESRIKQENGVYTVMTEKGEALIAPAVPGTKQGVEQIAGKERVVYRAEAGNPYGLEAGELAGYFYPDTYTVVDDLEKNATAVGAVALRGEVIAYQMAQIGAPQKVAIFPLPIDPTNADPKDDPRVIVQETTTATLKKKDIFMSVPKGAQIVNPIPPSSETNKNLSASEQTWGTSVSFGDPGNVLGKYRVVVAYDGGKTTISQRKAEVGFPILTIKSDHFTNAKVIELREKYRLIKPVGGINLEIYSQSSLFGTNTSDITDVGLNNVLKQGQFFTLVIATPQ